MSQAVTLDRLLRCLPELPAVAPLREALLAASVPDPSKRWASSAAYATYDKRVVDATDLAQVVTSAQQDAQAQVDALFGGLAELLNAASSGDDAGAARHLVQLGERAEAEDRPHTALAFYRTALKLAAPQVERAPLILALRRTARAHLALGEPAEALAFYRASAEDAAASGDTASAVIAGTGIGNVLAFQGRWADAESAYQGAYDAALNVDDRLRAQLCVNLSLVAREQQRLEEAEAWLEQARGAWERMSDGDRSVWWNNQGLLSMERGDHERAAKAFEAALDCAGGHFDRAMIYDNRAELAARLQHLSDAIDLSRKAEEHALAAGAPRALAEVYVRMGKLCGLNRDANGVTFFEKALELCRAGQYPLLEGTAHLEYGLFRQSLSEHDDAQPHLLRAREIFRDLGSERMAARVADALGGAGSTSPIVEAGS